MESITWAGELSKMNYSPMGMLIAKWSDLDFTPDHIIQNHYGDITGFDNYVTHGDYNSDGIDDFALRTGGGYYWLVYIYLGSPWFKRKPCY